MSARFIEDGYMLYMAPSNGEFECPHCHAKRDVYVDGRMSKYKGDVRFSLVVDSCISVFSDQHSQRNYVDCPVCGKPIYIEEVVDYEHSVS